MIISKKKSKIKENRYDFRDMSEIKAFIYEMMDIIVGENSYLKALFEKCDPDTLLKNMSKNDYRKIVERERMYFRMENAKMFESRLLYLGKSLYSLTRESTKLGIGNDETHFLFFTFMGAVYKFYTYIGRQTDFLNIKTRDKTQLVKTFFGMNYCIPKLDTLDIVIKGSEVNPVEKLKGLGDAEKKDLVINRLEPLWIQFLRKEDRQKLFKLLLVDSDTILEPIRYLQIFNEFPLEEKMEFWKILIPNLFPKEKKLVLEKLRVN